MVVNLWYYTLKRWLPFLLQDKEAKSSTLWVVSKLPGNPGSKVAVRSLGLCGHVEGPGCCCCCSSQVISAAPQEPLQGHQCINICTGGAVLVKIKLLHEKKARWRTSQSRAWQALYLGDHCPAQPLIKSPTPTGLPRSLWLQSLP